MHAGQVISLTIIVYISLPVALHVAGAAFEQVHLRTRKLPGLLRQFAQSLAQRPRFRVEVHKYQIEPFFGSHRLERELLGTESFNPLDLSRAEQRAVEAVGPAVITAAKQFARAAGFRRALRWRPRAVPADVIKTSQPSI